MSTLVTSLINRSLVKLGDPGATRHDRPLMLQAFNEVQDYFATELKCLEDDYFFNLEANEGAYAYPPNRVQIKGVWIARIPEPTQFGDYYKLDEKFEDEFNAVTYSGRPSGWVYAYYARTGHFELLNQPEADVTAGGLVSTWKIPTWIDVETPTAVMELPDFCRGPVQEGMEIIGRNRGRERAEATQEWVKWKDRVESLRDKFEDASDDRRSAIRPPQNGDWTQGMV